ncbi:MAG: energy-coupling factor ABC transporter ATP-binding protein [Thermoguttaceae bacterium]|nr:energy-coupling factor ABC transporter ATP-binding protein [Thermoguttaceae bacterium]MDW8036635.1 ABC transporter ATP-binding protein [Thermoguttaceae bacterium]
MNTPPPSVDRPLIRLEEIYFAYEPARPVLTGCNLVLWPGERVGLIGPTGSGKTTLLHLIVGLLRPSSGRIEIFGKLRAKEHDFLSVRRQVGLLFQEADDQLLFPTVAEDVAFGPLNLGKPKDQVRQLVRETLAGLGLAGYENRITYRLSGGEKRLVALAGLLAMQPQILLLDEPFAGLDEQTAHRVLHILARLPQTLLVVSHHRDWLRQIATRTVRLQEGKLLDE